MTDKSLSVEAECRLHGVNPDMARWRIRHGWSRYAAVFTPRGHTGPQPDPNSISGQARAAGVPHAVVWGRIRKDKRRALVDALKKTLPPRPRRIDTVAYKFEQSGLPSAKRTLIYRAVKSGASFDEAVELARQALEPKPIDAARPKSISARARELGLRPSTVLERARKGITDESGLFAPSMRSPNNRAARARAAGLSPSGARYRAALGLEETEVFQPPKTYPYMDMLRAAADAYGVSSACLGTRIRRGITDPIKLFAPSTRGPSSLSARARELGMSPGLVLSRARHKVHPDKLFDPIHPRGRKRDPNSIAGQARAAGIPIATFRARVARETDPVKWFAPPMSRRDRIANLKGKTRWDAK